MKIVQIIACGLLLCLSAGAGSAQELEKPAAVKAEGIDCQQAVLRHQDGQFVAEFQVRSLPEFNRYETFLGEEGVPAELGAPQPPRATWLVVMDTSDPAGRGIIIEHQKSALARFLSYLSPESQVGVYALSRELIRVDKPEVLSQIIGNFGSILAYDKNGNPQWTSDKNKKRLVWNPRFQSLYDLFESNGAGHAQMNTNLWMGLTRALREQLPQLAQGHYANLPKGILLISDGVDESPTSQNDLDTLIQEARKWGVQIHTLAYPHKNLGKNVDATAVHQGFNKLQRLSSETGGKYLSYDMFEVDNPSRAAGLKRIVEATETRLLNLSFPMEKLKGGHDITLQMRKGQQSIIANLNISQYDVAQVLGDYWLKQLCLLTNKARHTEGDEQRKLLLLLGQSFFQQLSTLPIRDDLFNYTNVDEPFARRVRQILAHLDANPDLMKQAQNSEDEMRRLTLNMANALINFGAPLPEPNKEVAAPQQPIVINNTPSGSGNDTLHDEDSLQDWVWWSLGIGGSALAVLFFWLIARLVNRSETPVHVVSGGQASEEVYAGPTKPVLASLVNTANPSQSWVVSSTSCRVGRHAGNDVTLPFSYVSGVQFILSRNTSGQWELRDAQSTNGTMVNGKKVRTAQLNSGDVIRIADLELEFKIR